MDDVGWKIGDLIRYDITDKYSRIDQKHWNGKIGVISQIRNKPKLAYVEWADNSSNNIWVSFNDMVLLNREHK